MTPWRRLCKPFLPCFHIHRLIFRPRVYLSNTGRRYILSHTIADGKCQTARFGYLVEQPREPLLLGQTRSIWTLAYPSSLHLRRLESCGLNTSNLSRLNHPDVQPTTTINRWIARIHLFDFERLAVNAQYFPGSYMRAEATSVTINLL